MLQQLSKSLKQNNNNNEKNEKNEKIVMTPEEIIKQEPLLAAVKDDLSGGVYNTLGRNGNMYEFCCQLKDILIEKYNVQFIFNEEVEDFLVTNVIKKDAETRHITGIVTKTGTIISSIDNVIVANGNYVMDWMQKLNIYMPIYPVKVKLYKRM